MINIAEYQNIPQQATILVTNGLNGAKTPLTTSDILSTNLVSNVEAVEWLSGGRLLIKADQNYTIIDTTKPDFPSTIFDGDGILTKYGRTVAWSFSHDSQYIAMGFEERKLERYRHSQFMEYKIARLGPKKYDEGVKLIGNVGLNSSGSDLLELFRWNPKSNSYAFVFENDVYYCEYPESQVMHQITKDRNRFVYNGISDWIYEEEILSSSSTLWWSRSGNYLAFLSIDDRNVTQIEYSIYDKRQYPFTNRIPYPKTGAKNLPKISLSIFDRINKQTKKMFIDLRNSSYATYLFSASWGKIRGNEVLVASFANRFQNYVSITICTFESGKCVLNYDQPFNIRDRQLWAEPEDFRINFFANDSYFVTLPHLASNGEIYNHIARITVPVNLSYGRAVFLPMGDYDVINIRAYNPKEEKISTTIAEASICYIVFAAANESVKDRCVTCDAFRDCTYQELKFAEDADKFVIICRGPGIQRLFLTSVSSNLTIRSSARRHFLQFIDKELGNYEKLKEKYDSKLLPRTHFENIQLKSGFVASVKMILPYELDLDAVDHKYPSIVSVYGGPGSRKVVEEYSVNSIDTLLGTKYVVVFIDARGSGLRGWTYKEQLLGRLGTVEVDDQTETIRLLTEKHRFLDPHRIGIWGWSYGGFAAALAIQRDEKKTFNCAASVAPVTNFNFYDATYTERYMGNASTLAYDRTDLMRNVTKFKNVQYLIIHGTADDNVHFQNTLQFIRTLEEQNIHFQLMVYPDGTHGLLWARFHLYTLLTEFFKKCFQ
ncbi:unnamed protein product [Enterobius vermicularis]|uniref:Dipeptidyl peptidase 4 n=1 Tax=Enterobius vermicularis TaxID=51028 RepID=A0A0N4V9W0_ENTVE|nr:unnamed protein product [Enterobius vermicularis]